MTTKTPQLPARPVKAWAIINPRGRVLALEVGPECFKWMTWQRADLGECTHNPCQNDFVGCAMRRGYRCIRVTISPIA